MTTEGTVAAFQYGNWNKIPAERVAEGIQRQMMWGDHLMVCRLTIAPGVITPVHSHVHEQITMVERGRVRYVVAGVERIVSKGDLLYFPSNVEHGATMLDEEVVLIDVFTPVREDFLPPSHEASADRHSLGGGGPSA
jgi:quercetin dioxygenase-like cupin family protein